MVCHHPAKFGGNRFRTSRDILLVCHVIKQDHVVAMIIRTPQRTVVVKI